MDQQQMATNPRLQRIRKVSRIFKYFFLFLFVVMTAFAASVWFLPMQGNGVVNEVKVNREFTRNETGGWDSKVEFATTQNGVTNFTNRTEVPPPEMESQTITKGFTIRFGGQNDDHIAKQKAEKPLPVFAWTVRPLGYISSLYIAVGFWIVYRLFHFFEMGLIFAEETVRCLKWIGFWLLGYWAWSNFIELTDWITQNPAFADLHFDLWFAGGFLVLLISWLMEEGRKLQEEQALTI